MHRLALVVLALLVLSAAPAAAADLQAAFARTAYVPGDTAVLRLTTSSRSATVQVLHAGVAGGDSRWGAPVDDPEPVRRAGTGAAWRVAVHVRWWPSGLYLARIRTSGGAVGYAPFVVGARVPGRSRVAVVLPSYTWQAYNFRGGGSWYVDPEVTRVDLTRAYLPPGLPPHFRQYDLGFLRWLARAGAQADFYDDQTLGRIRSGAWLARTYDLIVLPGHSEYVTRHELDLLTGYRDRGGNLAFLSANDLYRHVERDGAALHLVGLWRSEGRPESSLVGVQYIGWNENRFRNESYVARPGAAPWLYRGTGLHAGSRFGVYGIEVDARTPASPPATRVLATLPGIFGPGRSGEMTFYRTRAGAKVFAAGALNFGGSTEWPLPGRLLSNLWAELTSP